MKRLGLTGARWAHGLANWSQDLTVSWEASAGVGVLIWLQIL